MAMTETQEQQAITVLERDLQTARGFAASNEDDEDGPYWTEKANAYELAIAALRASQVQTETTPEQKDDQGAHVPHGGRDGLGPAARPELPHDGTSGNRPG